MLKYACCNQRWYRVYSPFAVWQGLFCVLKLLFLQRLTACWQVFRMIFRTAVNSNKNSCYSQLCWQILRIMFRMAVNSNKEKK